MHFKPVTAILFATLICFGKSYGGDTLSGKYPGAVLVQLRSEHNRIKALTAARQYDMAAEVEHDAVKVAQKFKLDFHNNFTYCPVYYYIDTNAGLIKNKQFDGVLFNEDGSPAQHPVINSNSTDYVIAYYGQALSQAKHTSVVSDTDKYTYDTDPAGKGLVILNDKFQQLTYFYKLGYQEGLMLNEKEQKNYLYHSKHFDIEYYPFAAQFNKVMLDRSGHHHTK